MSDTLLRTKLFIPQVRPSLVARPRLFAKLDSGLEAKLILVSAPAGYGKTTLVADWLHNSTAAKKFQFCWLSLDENDNDLARFLAYMTAALNSVQADADLFVLEIMRAQKNPPVEALVTHLLNDAAQIDTPFVMVLDDYHVIKSEAIHASLIFLLDHLPPQMRVVMISRADPPLPVARLRGQGQLVDVRQRELRFNVEETTKFLNQVIGLGLIEEDVRLLNERAEGWAAGLQMAAVSIQEQEDSRAFIQAFTGSNRYILDYLLEEVLQRQSQSVQQFLLETAVLNRLTARLCEYVLAGGDTDIEDAQTILEKLDAANLFVVPLDDQRCWYRYHRLFSDLLRQRLKQVHPKRIPILHRRACQWFREQNLYSEAFDHAVAGQDYVTASELAELMAEDMLRRSEIVSLINRVEVLPRKYVQERPELSLYFAWAHLMNGSALEIIESFLPQTTGDGHVDNIAALIYAFLAIFQGDLVRARSLSRQALAEFDKEERFWRSQAAWILSSAHTNVADQSIGDEPTLLEEAVKIGQETGNLMVAVSAMCEQAHTLRRYGKLHEAKALYKQALILAVDKRGRPYPIAGEALMGLGQLALEWNDLQEAEKQLLAGIEKTLLWREIAAFSGYLLLAQLRQAQGDATSADAAMEEARQLAVRFDASEIDDLIVIAYRARLWIDQGRLDETNRWAEERETADSSLAARVGDNYQQALRWYEEIVVARLWFVQGKTEDALVLLDRNLPRFEAWRRVRLLIEAYLLRAQILLKRNDADVAMEALKQAVSLGKPGGYIRVFLDEGEPIARLLIRLKPDNPEQQAYINQILAGTSPTDSTLAAGQAQPLIEPLSERELEVLRLIAAGLSNREIAQELVLSLATVKWHSSNIYGKIGVKNRTTAVAKARELNILPAS